MITQPRPTPPTSKAKHSVRLTFLLLVVLSFAAVSAEASLQFGDGSVNVRVPENVGSVELTVTRTSSQVNLVELDYATSNGSALANDDYISVSGTLQFPPGQYVATINVPIQNDSLDEPGPDESFFVTLSNPSRGVLGSEVTATISIDDDETGLNLDFESSSATVNEDAGTVSLNVAITNLEGSGAFTASVDFITSPGTATASLDFVPRVGVLNFSESVLIQAIVVPIIDDSFVEDVEIFTVQLLNPQGDSSTPTITFDTSTVTITDNDAYGAPVIQNLPQTVSEDIGTAFVAVSRVGGSSGTLTVTYQTSDLTANSPADYTSTVGTLTWADGDTSDRTIPISIVDDGLVEDEESLRLSLNDPNDPDQPIISDLTITDNDANAIVEFSEAALSVNETDGTVTMTVTRTGNSTGPVSVDINTLDGSADAESDYVTSTGVLAWGDGETDARTVIVSILDDSSIEEEENFTVVLTNPQGQADLGQNNTAIVAISDNDANAIVEFSDAAILVNETDGWVTLSILRTGTTSSAVSIDYASINGTATAPSDYPAASGTLNFGSGVTSQTITIPIVNDVIDEPDEDFLVTLLNPGGGAMLGSNVTITVTITNYSLGPSNILKIILLITNDE